MVCNNAFCYNFIKEWLKGFSKVLYCIGFALLIFTGKKTNN